MVKVLALELNGVFDITFYLSLIGLAQSDNSEHITTNDIHNTIKTLPHKSIASHAGLFVVAPGIFLSLQRVPFQVSGQSQRQSMFSKIGGVFVRVKGDFHSNFCNYV